MDEELIWRVVTGRATDPEREAIEAWRRSDAEHERRYRHLVEVLALATDAEQRRRVRSAPAAASIVASDPPRDAARVHRPDRRRWWVGIGAAAAVVLVALALSRLVAPGIRGDSFGADQFVTGPSETVTVALRDGSVVRLAERSRLQLTGGAQDREVTLTGRAFFAVAHDERRAFRVRTTAGTIEVLGTRFTLEADDEDLQLAVVEGRVALSARGHRAVVAAGELRRVTDGAMLPAVPIPALDSLAGWLGNFLAFQSTPLRDVAAEIEQRYGVQVRITDSSLEAQTVTTWFADRPLEDVVKVVCLIAQARCSVDDRVVIMSSR